MMVMDSKPTVVSVAGYDHADKNAGEMDEYADSTSMLRKTYNGHKSPTIFDAIKAGMLIPVQTLVDACGPEILHCRDEKGHTPAHWVCLGGHSTILRYIIEMKAPIDEPSENSLGQRPIHWACVNGHISVVDILIQWGVSIDTVDLKCCTPLIVAAQYGQTMLAGYLMGKGANIQALDRDEDTALHWAAFKGHSELMRLLVYSGLSAHQRDKFGQTPLHLACINGDLVTVQALCEQDHVELDIKDKNGKTPMMLALGRKHDNIVFYLQNENKQRTKLFPKFNIWSLIFGPPGNNKGALVFFLVNMLCWAYPMYIFKCLPETWYELQNYHLMFMFMNVMMWVGLYHASTADPGYLPRNTAMYDRAIKEVAHFDEWKQGNNPLSRLCHTCRTVKPLRSKHCRICNRCVKMFDHHCPYIYNCVGIRNRASFLVFVFSVSVIVAFCMYLLLHLHRAYGFQWLVVISLLDAIFGMAISAMVFLATVYHMVSNLTTNERINYKRYKYLQDARGKYHNPYDRGWKLNCLEFFNLKRPLEEDEVEFLNVTVI